jgi:hypothetical protein
MGLMLRCNLFHGTTAAAVYGAYVSFYEQRHRPLRVMGEDWQRIDFHCESNGWVVVSLDEGWEWKERREAQLFASRRLWCPGFLVFVYDGDYWGFEFFDRGEILDRFVQESSEAHRWFPGEGCQGNRQILVQHLPFLRMEDIGPYLVQKHDWVIPASVDSPARPGDGFHRFDECAVVDFLRMLGVDVELRDGYVCVKSSLYRSVFKAETAG